MKRLFWWRRKPQPSFTHNPYKYNGLEMDLSQWPDNCPYCYRELDNEHFNDACMRLSCPSGATEIHRCFTCGWERVRYHGQAEEHKCKCVERTQYLQEQVTSGEDNGMATE